MSPWRYNPPGAELVDNSDSLKACLADLYSTPPRSAIAVDLEGVDLCRTGKLCIMQLYGHGSKVVWIVDVITLGKNTFDEKDDGGKNLRGMLEDRNIKKVFFDLRNDSDALFAHYNVRLQGTYDLQILELVHRKTKGDSTRFVHGLGKTMITYRLASSEWKRVKEEGLGLFAPERGGSYQVFEERPLDERLITYCAQDVALLLELEKAILLSMVTFTSKQKEFVFNESAERVTQSQSASYIPHGRWKALGNINWRRHGL